LSGVCDGEQAPAIDFWQRLGVTCGESKAQACALRRGDRCEVGASRGALAGLHGADHNMHMLAITPVLGCRTTETLGSFCGWLGKDITNRERCVHQERGAAGHACTQMVPTPLNAPADVCVYSFFFVHTAETRDQAVELASAHL
jgi:hypothetical protein